MGAADSRCMIESNPETMDYEHALRRHNGNKAVIESLVDIVAKAEKEVETTRVDAVRAHAIMIENDKSSQLIRELCDEVKTHDL